jgi:hypothetical protein
VAASDHAKGFGAVKGCGARDECDGFLAGVDDVPVSELEDYFLFSLQGGTRDLRINLGLGGICALFESVHERFE